MQLAGKVALVTGAGSGIGKAAAELLAKEGAKVVVLGRTEEELEKTVAQIQGDDGEALPVVADISQPEQMQQATQQIVDKWGRIDIVFANASINGVWAPLEELAPEEWDKTLNINLKGTFLTVNYAVPYLKKQGVAQSQNDLVVEWSKSRSKSLRKYVTPSRWGNVHILVRGDSAYSREKEAGGRGKGVLLENPMNKSRGFNSRKSCVSDFRLKGTNFSPFPRLKSAA